MSIIMYVDKWVWLHHGLVYDEMNKTDKKYWLDVWKHAPVEFLSYSSEQGITIVRTDPIIYTKAKIIKAKRKLHKVPAKVHSGDPYSGGIWCDRHGCLHGTQYNCEFHPPVKE